MSISERLDQILEKSQQDIRLTCNDASTLFQATGDDLSAIMEAANDKRKEVVGDKITYVNNYNLNLTNICINNCQFCGFSKSPNSPEGYLLTLEDIKQKVNWAVEQGITEICLVSGLHPKFSLEKYSTVIREIKKIAPRVHIHGITPEELRHASRNKELGFKEGYSRLQEAGLDSIPGTAAEILVPEVRSKICSGKITAKDWITAIKQAHHLGFKSTATIMYGHLESIQQRVQHLKIIRDIQDETAGFTEFIPLSFVYQDTPLYQAGRVSTGASGREDLLMIAIARLFLDNIPNIQASWVKYGPKLAQLMLTAGANDLGGTLFNENITQEAGGEHGEYLSASKLEGLICDLGYTPSQRKTIY